MALSRKKPSDETAKGLVQLTDEEAIRYQASLIQDWTPRSDVWPFKYSISILAAAAGMSGIYANRYYRTKLKLGNMATISTYLPIVVLPATISAIFHYAFVTQDILIQRTPCLLCVQMRAAALQIFTSIVYPFTLAPLATFTFAARLHTYAVPYVTSPEGRKEALQLWRKFTKPILTPILLICAFQGLLAIGLTSAQSDSIGKINSKMQQLEQQYEEEHQNLV